MPDWFWNSLPILLVLGSIILMLIEVVDSLRHRRFTRRNAARIMFGFGFLVFNSPDVFYQSLPLDAKESITWFGTLIIFVSFAIESPWLQRRSTKV